MGKTLLVGRTGTKGMPEAFINIPFGVGYI